MTLPLGDARINCLLTYAVLAKDSRMDQQAFGFPQPAGVNTKITEHIGIRIIRAEYVRTHFGNSPQLRLREIQL